MGGANRHSFYCLLGAGLILSVLISAIAVTRTSVENQYVGNKLINLLLLSFNSYVIRSGLLVFPALIVVWVANAMVNKARVKGSVFLGATALFLYVTFCLVEGWYINHVYLPGIFTLESMVWNVIMLCVIAVTAVILFRGLWRTSLKNRTPSEQVGGAADA